MIRADEQSSCLMPWHLRASFWVVGCLYNPILSHVSYVHSHRPGVGWRAFLPAQPEPLEPDESFEEAFHKTRDEPLAGKTGAPLTSSVTSVTQSCWGS